MTAITYPIMTTPVITSLPVITGVQYYPAFFILLLALYIVGLNMLYVSSKPDLMKTEALTKFFNYTFIATCFCLITSYYIYNIWSNSLDLNHLSNNGWAMLILYKYILFFYTGFMIGKFVKRK